MINEDEDPVSMNEWSLPTRSCDFDSTSECHIYIERERDI